MLIKMSELTALNVCGQRSQEVRKDVKESIHKGMYSELRVLDDAFRPRRMYVELYCSSILIYGDVKEIRPNSKHSGSQCFLSTRSTHHFYVIILVCSRCRGQIVTLYCLRQGI